MDEAGISYLNKEPSMEKYIEDQGSLIIPKEIISKEDAQNFFMMFWGRTDVYSQRSISKTTGVANYYPQCYKIWKAGCPKRDNPKYQCSKCSNPSYKKLEASQIIAHLRGTADDGTDVIGVYPLMPDDTCRFIVFDFDNHEKGAEKKDFANNGNEWKEEVDALREICRIHSIDCLVERSRSGQGAHLWIFFQSKIEASLARKFGFALLKKGAESVNLKSFLYYDRMLPMQDHIPAGGFGNLIALPLQGQALKKGNSAFVDEQWNAYSDQWKCLLSKQKLSLEQIEEKLKGWEIPGGVAHVALSDIETQSEVAPWDRSKQFFTTDVDGSMQIILSDGIYIKTSNLRPRIQNQIREMAAFSNPKFFKNQAIGLSNFQNTRYIYLGRDIDGYIRIPRGLFESLCERLQAGDILFEISDKRAEGKQINVEFKGKLKASQRPAVEKLKVKETGILQAATAFGKTVVCCDMIAERKTSTLILLQSSALMEQWEKALNDFLQIDEPLPKYQTKTGRTRTRKSLIGKLQGASDSTTGIIDIAMVGSLCKKGMYHPRLKEYGMVILDECHHAASDTIVDVLQEVKAKYVYGVTATPARSDGLEKINYMLLGPIRHKYTSKERAKEQGIEHLVYPRFTRAVAPRFGKDKMHPNEAYAIIRDNKDRDDIIVSDVKQCIEDGRTPVILSRFVDHSQRLYERVQEYADHVFLLSGANSRKEHKNIISEMNSVRSDESMILVATGGLVGEGFDFPRLDTLIMATPVAWKSIVEQYAGRLNRDYEGKKNVIIYDYVDSHISMFENMYNKRLKSYKQIGYEIYSGIQPVGNNLSVESEINAIYDAENYKDVYEKDVENAANEIIISSPVIRGDKIDELVKKLNTKQLNGVTVRIITWKADSYGYGDSAYWMELHERMRTAGFQVNLVEEYCEHYCMIDRSIVWYGSMNFLGKEDAEDNLMRVNSEKICAELLELTFGSDKYFGELL